MKRTKKTDAATHAKTVSSETVSSTPATVGVVVTSAITKKMSIPELMAVMAPAAVKYNQCIGAVIKNEGTARRLEKDILYPGLLRYREWIKSTPVAERKQVTEHYTLTKYVKFLGVGESLLRLWEFRDKHKKLGTKVLQLSQEAGQSNDQHPTTLPGNKQGANVGSNKPGTKKPTEADEQKEKERREREEATAKLLSQKAEAEQILKNANLDLSVAISFAEDNPTESDRADIAKAQAKVEAAHAAWEDAAEAIAVLEQKVPIHEASTDSNTVLSDTTQTPESEVLTPASDAPPIPPLPGATFTRADTLVKDLKRADEGSLVVSASGPTPTVRVIECEIVPDGNRDAMATLRGVYNRMADTADIESELEVALKEFVQPIMAEHPYMKVDTPSRPELQISVTLHRAGRARICAGDWVEYRGGDDRLTKQIGSEAALGRVVEADPRSRPRVIWSNGTKWLKPYSLFNEEAVHVLFADQAASAYPASSTYSEATWTQLVPGKKYQVRPAPSGGYGIYEPRSTVLLQLFTEEDDARDAIGRVSAMAVGA